MSFPSILRPARLIIRKQRPQHLSTSNWRTHTWARITHRVEYYTTRQPLRSSVPNRSSLNVTAVLIIVIGSSVGSLYYYQKEASQPGDPPKSLEDPTYQEEHAAIMAGVSLPGRPGNLTPEQEVKLQEMWTATLKVFGVPGLDSGLNGDAASTTGSGSLEQAEKRSRAGTGGSEKKSRKRVSLFSRKHHDDTEDKDASGDSAMDGDDKYGQTKEFHKVLASQSPTDLRAWFWSMVKHDNPDGLLLRFLRARKWNVQNALIMLISTMHWRGEEMHVDDDIMRSGEGGAVEDSNSSNAAVKKEGNDFLTQTRLGKSFLHGTDKEGRPMCFVNVRLHKQGEQSESSLERYTVFTIETARLLLASNVDTAAVVFDMTDFSMANMDYGPVKFMIKCFEANYPESLGVVLVHKSPWIFQSIWKIIRGWLDPVVASKVHFTKNEKELEEYVDRSQIPKGLGGGEDWTYLYIEPVSGENKLQSDDSTRQLLLDERAAVVRSYESTTQQWIQDSGSRETLQQKRSELAERLRTGYWKLDPYLRAKSFCDRTGMIREGGRIHFYESPNGATTSTAVRAPVQNGPLPAGHGADDLD